MDAAQLEQIAAQIGEEILARTRRAPAVPATPIRRSVTPLRPQPIDQSVAAVIDHTILKPEATAGDVRKVCREAKKYGFAAVCVNPCWVALCADELKDTTVKVCTVAGFPLGASVTETKVAEAEHAVRAGAHEIDMVINVGALRSGDLERVRLDIQAVAQACHRSKAILKVILETALLTEHQKVIACVLAKLAQADFVKTSTGFSSAGATASDVKLMRETVGPALGVKAAGGVRTLEDLRRMVSAGASRVGASASVSIIEATTKPGA